MGWDRFDSGNRFAGGYGQGYGQGYGNTAREASFQGGGGTNTVRAFGAAMQRAIAPHRQTWRAGDASSDPRVRLQAAVTIAAAAAGVMQIPIGRIKIIQGNNAYADERGIFFGADLAATLPVKTLAQILLHEAGHRHAGHTSEMNDLIVQLLQATGATLIHFENG